MIFLPRGYDTLRNVSSLDSIPLNTPLRSIPGIGDRSIPLYERLGLRRHRGRASWLSVAVDHNDYPHEEIKILNVDVSFG